MKSPTILFCGGGSAGHLIPSLAVLEILQEKILGLHPVFVCAPGREEQNLLKGIEHHPIHAGKFPRGFSLRIFTFPFLFVLSFIESFRILLCTKPQLVFSKGGFVSVPVCVASRILGIPIVLHMSDSVPSLSDRLVGLIAVRVCSGFPPSLLPSYLQKKAVHTGNPVRAFIARGSVSAAQRITGFSGRRPVLMVIGGSQGSKALNEAVEKSFAELLDLADLIHLTGTEKGLSLSHARYFSRAFVVEELPHLYALSDLIVTRAGAGVLSELSVLKKPAIVVPLAGVAHDHQVKNATVLSESGAASLLMQKELSTLTERVRELLRSEHMRRALGENLARFFGADAKTKVADCILDVLGRKS